MLEYKLDSSCSEVYDMFKNIENFKIENIHAGTARKSSSVLCRNSSSLILRATGTVRYTFPERSFDIHPGDIIFLPQGCRYDFATLTDSPCNYVAINIVPNVFENQPFVYSINDFPEFTEVKNNLSDMWKFGGPAERYRCYSIIYSLLSYMKNQEKIAYIDKKKFHVISPAVSYLKKHIYDCNLKIETLIQLCGVSGTYFQKIFQANYSMSPQKYILSKRLSHAKAIIDSGDFDTISEIANSVGYADPLYFSRAFKKKYGFSPSHYIKQVSLYNQ